MIALTAGDPRGIGAEVAVAAWAGQDRPADVALVGPADVWRRAAELLGVDGPLPVVDVGGARPEIAAIEHAVAGALDGTYAALCTMPIHKGDLLAAGFRHPGHTPFLAELCGLAPDRAVMLFAGGRLAVALATVHLPLRDVPGALTLDRLIHAATASAELMQRLGPKTPRVAVCGLNPHAGEGGALGSEDADVVHPAVVRLRQLGLDASGPHPADTVFARAARGDFDLVIACYHDQGLIPVKTLDFGQSVNITAGLPILRTSVDHGTARDIAWTGRADARHADAALKMARRLWRG